MSRSTGWNQRNATLNPSSTNTSSLSASRDKDSSHRTPRRGGRSGRPLTGNSDTRASANSSKTQQERRGTSANKTPSQASSSRPPTPAPSTSATRRPMSPGVVSGKSVRIPKEVLSHPPRSPTSSIAVESDIGSQDTRSSSPLATLQTDLTPPPGIPAVPPGLTGPLTSSTASSPAPVIREPSSSLYQISTQAQALLDDVRARRESLTHVNPSPFPDFDRTLQNITGGDEGFGGFKFNLDPKLAGKDTGENVELPDVDAEVNDLFPGTNLDPYSTFGSPAQQSPLTSFMTPPGLSMAPKSGRSFDSPVIGAPALERQLTSGSSYTGSFNPFGESSDNTGGSSSAKPLSLGGDDLDRRVSRFGFARERQGSGLSVASSPLHSADTSLHSDQLGSSTSSYAPWPFQRTHEYGPPPGLPMRTSTPSSARNSPLVSYATTHTPFMTQQSRFQPFGPQAEDMSLKDLIGIGQERSGPSRGAPSGRTLLFV